MIKRFLVPALMICVSVAAIAQGPTEPTGESSVRPRHSAKKTAAAPAAPTELSDEGLESTRASMDGRFAARVAAIKNSADAREVFLVRVEKKRFDFERHALEERKAFYVYLKSVAMDERGKALKDFEEKEERNRSKFDKDLLADEKDWYDQEIDKNWKSSSLMAESAPAVAARPAAAAIKPKAAARMAAKKEKAVARKRKSRIKEPAQQKAAEPEAVRGPSHGKVMQAGAPDAEVTN